jgi:hypothetical protein
MHEISNSYTTHGFKDLDVFAVRDSHLPRRDLAKRQTGGMYMLHSRSTPRTRTPPLRSGASQGARHGGGCNSKERTIEPESFCDIKGLYSSVYQMELRQQFPVSYIIFQK